MSYYVPDRTAPRNLLKQNGQDQKAPQWAQVQGVPCKLVNSEAGSVVLHSFVSDPGQNFRVSNDEFSSQFAKAVMDGEWILGVAYPGGRLSVSEFDKRKEASDLISKALKVIHSESLSDKLKQTNITQGCTHTATIDKYNEYKNGTLEVKTIENFGDPIFNRSKRHSPPVDISHDEFKLTKGFPAPLGIRPKDFCLPSDVIKGVIELLVQMARFENSPPEIRAFLHSLNINVPEGYHCCKWCGKTVDASKCESKYKSQTNYIELCHRDPNATFTCENVYWGHGDCNRRQGGYTEIDRFDDVANLANQDPAKLARLLAGLSADGLLELRKLIGQN